MSYTTFGYSGLQTTHLHGRRADVKTPTSAQPGSASSRASTQSASASVTASASGSISPTFSASASASISTSASAGGTSSASNATSTASAPPAGSSPVGNSGGPAALYEDLLRVSFRVQNTGALAGNEVSQLYLGFPAAYDEPPKVLRGFARTMLGHGQGKMVTIPLRQKDVSVWDVVSQQWVVAKGEFTVMVGSSSRAIHLTGTFEL